ncbi:hypothetical protein [Flagellimonas lutimaris]|uniref:hypothetical protein n=1 Tax=Flagellimonas lutimaris TaxID=475082 RepID=UPI003F5CF7F7
MDKVWTATMDDTQNPHGQRDFKFCTVHRLNTVKSMGLKLFLDTIPLKKHGFYMDKPFFDLIIHWDSNA